MKERHYATIIYPFFCQITIILVFIISVLGKLRDIPQFVKTIGQFQILTPKISWIVAFLYYYAK